jgi:hypothetical protein
MPDFPTVMDLELGGLRQTIHQLEGGWALVRYYNQNRQKGKAGMWYELLSPDEYQKMVWRIIDQDRPEPPDE